MVCMVRVKETITIPPLSSVYIHVEIPHKDQLSKIALVEPASHSDKVHLAPGIIDTTERETKVQIQNHDCEEATLFKNTKIGECQSIYLNNPKVSAVRTVTESEANDAKLSIP